MHRVFFREGFSTEADAAELAKAVKIKTNIDKNIIFLIFIK
jgi:hypothetical protein